MSPESMDYDPAVPGVGEERFKRRSLAAPLIITAVVLLTLFGLYLYGSWPVARWYAMSITRPDDIIAPIDEALTTGRIEPGDYATGEGSKLVVQLGEGLRLQLEPGTSIELPPGPGRWFGKKRTIVLGEGEVLGVMAGADLTASLAIETREARVTFEGASFAGAAFAVSRQLDTTCVMLERGDVSAHVVLDRDKEEKMPEEPGQPLRVPPGHELCFRGAGQKSVPAMPVPLGEAERRRLQEMPEPGPVR
jgi:hypothetical protein